eukprot:9726482-Alexandrium_andersonii.AAC.1
MCIRDSPQLLHAGGRGAWSTPQGPGALQHLRGEADDGLVAAAARTVHMGLRQKHPPRDVGRRKA